MVNWQPTEWVSKQDDDSYQGSPVSSPHQLVDDEANVYQCVTVVPRNVLLYVANDVAQRVGGTTFLGEQFTGANVDVCVQPPAYTGIKFTNTVMEVCTLHFMTGWNAEFQKYTTQKMCYCETYTSWDKITSKKIQKNKSYSTQVLPNL